LMADSQRIVGSNHNLVRLSFVKGAVQCSTLQPPHPLPLSPKGERGAANLNLLPSPPSGLYPYLGLDTGGGSQKLSPLPWGEGLEFLHFCPLPWGEGGPLPAFSSAGAGRVRGYFNGPAQVFAAVRSAVILCPCASPRNARPNCAAPKLIPKKRRGICCATEGWARNFAAHAASKTALSISTASNIDWRWSWMAVCTGSPAQRGKRLRKRIIGEVSA